MTSTKYTVWGYHPGILPDPFPIRLTGGNLSACRTETKQRTETGWTVGIYADGDMPLGLRDRIVADSVNPAATCARQHVLAGLPDLGWLATP